MDDAELSFARDIIAAFGEDRFYHALVQASSLRRAEAFHAALGGTQHGWNQLKYDLRLSSAPTSDKTDDEAHVLYKVAYRFSLKHKEFALRSPMLPAALHARMMLCEGNEWTRKYSERLEDMA